MFLAVVTRAIGEMSLAGRAGFGEAGVFNGCVDCVRIHQAYQQRLGGDFAGFFVRRLLSEQEMLLSDALCRAA